MLRQAQHEVFFALAAVDAMKSLPHAELVEARTTAMQPIFPREVLLI